MKAGSRILVALAVALVAAAPAALAVSSSVDVKNSTPTIVSVTVPSVTATAGTNVPVTVTVVASDLNGYADLTGLSVTVLKPDGTTVHVASAAAVLSSASGTQATYTYSFTMKYWDAPAVGGSTYKVKAVATDAAGATGDNAGSLAGFAYNKVVALNLAAPSVNFGSSLVPGTSSAIVATPVANYGNVRIDVAVSGTGLAKSGGPTIPAGAVWYARSTDMTGKLALATSPSTLNAFDLATGATSSSDLHWQLALPEGLPAGTYGGTLTVDAVEG